LSLNNLDRRVGQAAETIVRERHQQRMAARRRQGDEMPDRNPLTLPAQLRDLPARRVRDSHFTLVLLCFGMLDVAKSLPEDPEELRRFTALLLAEVKSQAMLIEKLRHRLVGHRSHRFGPSSETIEQLQLALEASEIAVAKMTAQLRLPDEEPKDKPKRRQIPDHIPSQEIELTTGDDDRLLNP
jgi:hypothetical protein